VQLSETIDPRHLFGQYVYLSSQSSEFVKHAETLAHQLIAQRRISSSSQVIEIVSNDGYLLQHYRNVGIPILGIEPAANIAEIARVRGIDTISEFFSAQLAGLASCAGPRPFISEKFLAFGRKRTFKGQCYLFAAIAP